MGMFSMGEGREIREVDELRAIRRPVHARPLPSAEREMDQVLSHAETPVFKRTAHYAMEIVGAAGVEYLSEQEAKDLEDLMNKAIRGLNAGSKESHSRVFGIARRETIVQIKKGKI